MMRKKHKYMSIPSRRRLGAIMRRAHAIKKRRGYTFKQALKKAWHKK